MFNPLHDIAGSKILTSKSNKKFSNERILGYKRSSPKNSPIATSNYAKFFKMSKTGKKTKRPKSSLSYSKGGKDTEKKMEMSAKETRLPSGKTRKSRPFSSRSMFRNTERATAGAELTNTKNSYIEGKFLKFF